MPATTRATVSASATKLEPGDLIDECAAAARLGVRRKTLQNWRALRKGPSYRKIGARMVRYRVADLDAFQRVVTGEAGEVTA